MDSTALVFPQFAPRPEIISLLLLWKFCAIKLKRQPTLAPLTAAVNSSRDHIDGFLDITIKTQFGEWQTFEDKNAITIKQIETALPNLVKTYKAAQDYAQLERVDLPGYLASVYEQHINR